MICPFCKSDIPNDALKCKYCGEWVNKEPADINRPLDGSQMARAVAKGIKKKEQDDSALGCCGLIVILAAVAAGSYTHWFVGLLVFIIGLAFTVKLYNKE